MASQYRQIAHRLRVQRGPGRPDLVSERPRRGSKKQGWGDYLDSPEHPTLVEFDEYCQVDIPALLRQGAIAPREPREEVQDSGEAG